MSLVKTISMTMTTMNSETHCEGLSDENNDDIEDDNNYADDDNNNYADDDDDSNNNNADDDDEGVDVDNDREVTTRERV